MKQTVLSQLQSVEAELALQESQLGEQLAAVQEKLSGIRAVLPMFSGAEDMVVNGSAAPKAVKTADEPVATAPAVEAEAAKAPKTKKSKAIAVKQTTQKKPAVKKSAAKTDGRTASWQKYTRPGVKNESIPDAVRLILATQPEREFKIVEVMAALFKEEMPRAQYLKARNRISNVLSGGVRAGDWYKGEQVRGTYRMTKG
ncbi:MAG: hypothetical protein DCF15_15540 [Phormidesmis priestleyi]|uniref:Uncharacterized protein n=1 Tax=Phormidesmis priestleyi TaxID=268141 RepID=A0A2W4X8L8_9CYAN|nr:MAG: hypothetical protein DCF15_15540 [Phormidesmis priestleyi]